MKEKVQKALNGKSLKTMHISSLAVWDLGLGKGRISTYLPLKTLSNRGHEVLYLCSASNQESMDSDGISVRKLRTVSPISKAKYLKTPSIHLNSLLCTIQALYMALKYRPDVVYAHGYDSAFAAFAISKVMKIKYVLKQYGTTYFASGRI